MTETTLFFKVQFNGIYEWGGGWLPGMSNKWHEFWNMEFPKMHRIFWSHFSNQRPYGEVEYLVATQGSAYLHPMNFSGTLTGCGCTCDGKHFCGEIEELKKICEACAAYCGGSCEVMATDEITVERGEMKLVG